MKRPGTGPVSIAGLRRRRNRRINGAGVDATRDVLRGAVSVAMAVVVTVATVFALHQGWRILLGSKRLQVAEVAVRGTVRAAPEDVEALAGVRPGDALLGMDLDAVAASVRRHPWVRAAAVRRRLPDQVIIEVEEHAPALLVSVGEVYVANPDGQLFKKLAAADGIVLPVLTGLDPDMVGGDTMATAVVVREAAALLAAAEAVLERVDEIGWDPDLGWSVMVTRAAGVSTRVHLGFDPVARLDASAEAMARLDAHGHRPFEVWADGAKNPSRVHARVTPASRSPSSSTLMAKVGP